jgi:hypothetical protein
MCSLGEVLNVLHHGVQEKLPLNLTTNVHSFKAGDKVWKKEWNLRFSSFSGEGPILTTLIGEGGKSHPMHTSQVKDPK